MKEGTEDHRTRIVVMNNRKRKEIQRFTVDVTLTGSFYQPDRRHHHKEVVTQKLRMGGVG